MVKSKEKGDFELSIGDDLISEALESVAKHEKPKGKKAAEGPQANSTESGEPEAADDRDAQLILVVPRLGTISPLV